MKSVVVERHYIKSRSFSEVYGSASETPRRSGAQIESVHSSSDRDMLYTPYHKLPKIEEEEQVDVSVFTRYKIGSV
jgi:hypothetical protein